MKTGRVYYNGQALRVTESKGRVRFPDGELKAESTLNWLPPIDVGNVYALGLNYADHAAELDFKAPEIPLIFLKGKSSITAHRCFSPRPDDVAYMHYECELAVIIGSACKNVSVEEALDYVAGYSVANDYAIRDYLENFYRPNLRVKNRDFCTPMGPWMVDAKSIRDPQNLALKTYVNGVLTQSGTTADMIFSVATLISYISEFATLQPGDVILTGTPKGLTDTQVGDVVVCEIEGVGRLVNTITSLDEVWHLNKEYTND